MSNARTKRLNESDKPVLNMGIADDFHKLIIPQNTTVNLAAITPLDIGSIAYDTTLDEVVIQTGSGFIPISSGADVSSLNGISGAVTLVPGTNISITPSGQNITIANTAPAGANTSLSNLSSTAVNANIVPNTGATYNLGSLGNAWETVYTESVEAGGGGVPLALSTSNQGTGSGNISLTTGSASSGPSGSITMTTGSATGGAQGAITMAALYLGLPTGTADPTAPAGSIYYNTTSNTIRWYNGTAWAALT